MHLNSAQRRHHHQLAPYVAPAHHYAQTISRATNLHQVQLLRGGLSQAPLAYQDPQQVYEPAASLLAKHALLNKPLCRCRVMYLGSSVPHITKNGLHGIQEPLKHLYPEEQFTSAAGSTNSTSKSTPNTIDISHLSSSLGIDSWLSVWSNGLLLENVDELGREIKRFFSIESLHYCAAVRFFDTANLSSAEQPGDQNNNQPAGATRPLEVAGNESSSNDKSEAELASLGQRKSMVRFLPLDAPLFQCPGMIDAKHPPVFAAIMRRTTGIKVLECHAFICRRDAASNALVRCCTHAYSDFLNAKRLSLELNVSALNKSATIANGRTRRRSNHRSSGNLANRSSCADSLAVEAIINTTASTSQQNSSLATATSNEENSLEASSGEDNYAIISQRLHQPRSLGETNKLDESTSRKFGKRSDRSSPKGQQGKAKGSSKSLFNDFMPKTSEHAEDRLPSLAGEHNLALEKLSHSLDFLQLAAAEASSLSADTADNDVKYSVVRNKRNSRSMQNLNRSQHHQLQMNGPIVRSSSRIRKNHRGHRRDSAAQSRKATSYQDMLVNTRKSSLSSNLTSLSLVGSQSNDQPNSDNNLDKIYSLDNTDHSAAVVVADGDIRGLRPDQRVASRTHSSKSKKSTARRRDMSCPPPKSRSRRESDCIYEPIQPATGMMQPNGHYYPHQPYNGQPMFSYPHQQQASLAPVYMPFYLPASQYHHHNQLYAPPVNPAYEQALSSGLYGAPNHQLLSSHYATPQGVPAQAAYLSPSRTIYATNPLGVAATMARGRSKQPHSSLARFRCLSPPVNFLTETPKQQHPSGDKQQHRPATTSESNRESADLSNNGEQTDIVSAEPGFIQSATVGRQKKMGWIKRLSLTMSTGGQSDDSAAATLSADPNGAAQPRRKRTSLFAGSLTLGRGKQQHANLVTSE